MPFKSKAQRRKFAELLVKGEISPETFEEWNRETGNAELPERASRKRPKKKRARSAKKTTRARKRPKTRAAATNKTTARKRPKKRATKKSAVRR
jgi:hypothetical protein